MFNWMKETNRRLNELDKKVEENAKEVRALKDTLKSITERTLKDFDKALRGNN